MTAPDPVAALREDVAGVVSAVIEDHCPHEDEHPEGTCEVCDYAFALPDELTDALLAHLAPLVEARERVEALADQWDATRRSVGPAATHLAERAAQLRAANALGTPTGELGGEDNPDKSGTHPT